jgi:hypothetical protein
VTSARMSGYRWQRGRTDGRHVSQHTVSDEQHTSLRPDTSRCWKDSSATSSSTDLIAKAACDDRRVTRASR